MAKIDLRPSTGDVTFQYRWIDLAEEEAKRTGTIRRANLPRLNLRQMAEDRVVKGLQNETVRITSVSNS